MKAKGIFISTLLVIDTFFVSYAAGFHSRHVLVINPKLPPVVHKKTDTIVAPIAVPAKKSGDKNKHQAKDAHAGKNAAGKSHGKDAHKSDAPKIEKTKEAAEKPAAKPDTQPPAKSETKSSAKPVSKPAAKPTNKPKAKPAAKPAAKADEKPGA